MSYNRYVAKRLLQIIPSILAVMTIVFFMVRFLPGDPVEIMLRYSTSEEAIDRMRELYGIGEPLWEQYLSFVIDYAQLDFGSSITRDQDVNTMIAAVIPHTIILAIGGTVVAVLVGVPAGIISAVKQDTWVDDVVMSFAMLGVSTPGFWIGLLLIMFFAVTIPIFPATGSGDLGNPISVLYHLILPSITLGTFSGSLIARITRGSMLEVLDKEYVTAARARGVRERVVIYRHAFRNASIPVVTVVGLFVGQAIAGTIVIEQVFARPGLGVLLLESIYARDYPTIQAGVFVIAVGFMLVNLVTDLAYGWLDPKIKY